MVIASVVFVTYHDIKLDLKIKILRAKSNLQNVISKIIITTNHSILHPLRNEHIKCVVLTFF